MNERKIKVVIDVKDEEVKQATSSLTRLEKAAKDVGKSGNDIKNLDDGLKNATTSAAGLAAGFNPIALAVTVATTAVLAFTAALIAATKYAFELAKSFADYGSEIYKAQQLTTLTAETLSTLKIEVEKAGGSFESIIDGLKDYATKIADAAKGSKEAQKELNSLGINGKKYLNDFNGALEAGFKAISKLPPGIAQMSAATKLFGEEASRDLIPIIRKADGDISKLTEELKQFGIVLSQEDLQASREFNKAMGEVQMELRGVGLTVGREVLPVFRDLFKEFQGFYKENKNEIKEWAVYLADILRGAIEGFSKLVTFIKENWGYISSATRIALGIGTMGGSEVFIQSFGNAVNQFESQGKATREAAEEKNREISWQSWDSSKVPNGSNYFKPDPEKEKKKNTPSIKEILDAMRQGTMSQESGGRSRIQNPRTNATGLFQVMPENIPNWTEKHLGQRMTVEQFRNSPSAQIAVFNAQMGGYLEKGIKLAGGNWEEGVRRAAVQWYGTKSNTNDFAQVKRFRPDEPSRGEYTSSILAKTKKALKMKDFGSSTDFDKIQDEIVKADNEAFAREKFEKLAAFYKNVSAIIPSEEFLKSYTDFLNKDIPLDRNKLTTFDVKKQFEKPINDGVTTEGGAISDIIEYRPTLGGEYLKNLKESLEAEKKIEQVVALREKHQEIINALFDDALEAQDLQLENLGNQYELQQRLFGDETYRKYEQDIANLEEKLSLEREIFDLENNIANSGLNDSLKIKAAYLQDIISLREREVDAVMQINRAELELSQKGVFSQNQANAAILDHLNSVKSVTEIYADARISIIDNFWNGIDSAVGSVTKKLGFFGGIIKQLIVDFIKLATLKPLQNIFAPGASGGASQSSGGGFSFGNILQKFFGGGGASGGYTTPPFVGNNFSFAGAGGSGFGSSNSFAGSISRLIGGGSTGSNLPTGATITLPNGEQAFNVNGNSQLSTYSQFKQFFSGSNLSSLAMASLPAAAIGLFLSSLKETSLAKGAAKGGIVGLIASIFNRNKLRREEEKVRDKLMVDTLAELNKIKAEMEAARPGTNIQGLLDQTGQISAEYFTQANALKDKKTRGIAIEDGRLRVGKVPTETEPKYQNALTNQIYALSEAAKAKQQIREFAAERDRRMLPEFAMGGYIPAKNGGHLAVVGEGGFDEFILSTDPRYANRTAKLLGNFIERMNYKIPKFEMGGISSNINLSPSNSASTATSGGIFQPNITIVLNNTGMVETDIHEILIDGLKKPNVQVELKKNFDKAKSRRV